MTQRCSKHDGMGQRLVGHTFAEWEVLWQSAVCTAAPLLEDGRTPRQKEFEVGAQGGRLLTSERWQQPLKSLLQDRAFIWHHVVLP